MNFVNPISANDGMSIINQAPTTKNSGFTDAFNKAVAKLDKADLEAIYTKASEKYGVSSDLLKAVSMAESCFNPNATSKSGAMGIMQLMPYTAEELGVKDAYDPEQNIMGGAALLARYLKKFDGNTSYALAAYNAGGNAVEKYNGIPPYKETQNYVAKVLGYLEDGGVNIPSTWSGETSSAVEQKSNLDVDATLTTLGKLAEQLFSYDDYLDFLKLFVEMIENKIDEKALETLDGATKTDTIKSEARKTSDNTEVSEAYVAYKNLTAANKMMIYLNPLQS